MQGLRRFIGRADRPAFASVLRQGARLDVWSHALAVSEEFPLSGDEVICHGDFGPWNIVWRNGMPSAVIDFDNVYAGDAAEDVAYALRMFVGYGFAAAEPVELVRRTCLALTTYGGRREETASGRDEALRTPLVGVLVVRDEDAVHDRMAADRDHPAAVRAV